MKYKKLPNLTIKNALTQYPMVDVYVSKTILVVRSIAIVTVVLALTTVGYIANVKYEESIGIQNRIETEKTRANLGESGIVLDATSKIISREGNLPIDLARKYAVWIYESSARHNIDPLLALAVAAVESRFDYKAVSPTGPGGIFQIAQTHHPEKISKAGLFDPKQNIDAGLRILREYSDRSSTDISMLARYNGSSAATPVYAVKVLNNKRKFEAEIMKAIVSDV